MSKDSPKDIYSKCIACDYQKLKKAENNPIVRELRDKIEQMNIRLTEGRNENQMLKRSVQLAKKMVYTEVGGCDMDFQALLKYGAETGSKERQQSVLLLKTKVHELKDHLKELEGDPPPPQETPSDEYVKYQMTNDRKMIWRLELDRQLARKKAEKDISPLEQECFELRKCLYDEKNRFKELNEEVKLLRRELENLVEKNEEDVKIMNSYKTLETQLQETLAERAAIRNDLAGSRARNKRLTEKLAALKDELHTQQKKTCDSNELIESLKRSNKNIQEAINAEKTVVQQSIERYKSDLIILEENHRINCEMLDHMQSVIEEREEMIEELKKNIRDGLKGKDNEEDPEFQVKSDVPKVASKESKTLQPTTSKSKERVNSLSEDPTVKASKSDIQLLESRKLRIQCAKYKVLCEAAEVESKTLEEIIVKEEKKMNEVAAQVVKAGQLVMQKNIEEKDRLEKVSKLQKSISAERRWGKFHVQSKNRLEELRIRTDAQREENDFLRNFLRSVLCLKAKDLQTFKRLISETKHFFLESLQKTREQLEANPKDHNNDQPPAESVDEQNNETTP